MKAGRELDALVAERVMGWRKGGAPPLYDGPWISPDKLAYVSAELPRYSSDIAAAWAVVEKLREGGRFAILVGALREGNYYCKRVSHCEQDSSYPVTADTAPHAISLAALKAVGYEVAE